MEFWPGRDSNRTGSVTYVSDMVWKSWAFTHRQLSQTITETWGTCDWTENEQSLENDRILPPDLFHPTIINLYPYVISNHFILNVPYSISTSSWFVLSGSPSSLPVPHNLPSTACGTSGPGSPVTEHVVGAHRVAPGLFLNRLPMEA